MKIYIAGMWARRAELAVFANKLREQGHYITAHWLTSDKEDEDMAGWKIYAERDMQDIYDAELFILFTEHDPPKRNSRLVELGLALGDGLDITVIGPIETIFCTLADDHYATVEDCLRDMAWRAEYDEKETSQ